MYFEVLTVYNHWNAKRNQLKRDISWDLRGWLLPLLWRCCLEVAKHLSLLKIQCKRLPIKTQQSECAAVKWDERCLNQMSLVWNKLFWLKTDGTPAVCIKRKEIDGTWKRWKTLDERCSVLLTAHCFIIHQVEPCGNSRNFGIRLKPVCLKKVTKFTFKRYKHLRMPIQINGFYDIILHFNFSSDSRL